MKPRTWSALVALLIITGCGGGDSTSTNPADSASDSASDTAAEGTGGSAAPSGPGGGGTLTVGRVESFDGWRLDSAAAYATYQTHPAVIEPLLRFAADGIAVEPGLAEKWTYDETTSTWSFTLRANATFSNGQAVTSADVVFSYGIWSSGINFGGSFSQIKSVEAVDPLTVNFVMKTPDSVLPALLSGSIAGVMPDKFAGMTEEAFYAAPIGAGPYTVTEWSSGGRIVLDRNPSYYAPDRPYFDEVVIDVIADDSEISRLFQSGELDIVNYVSITSAGQYDAANLVVTAPSQISHVSLNTTRAPFDDLATRQAVAQAIDYNSISKGLLAGYGKPPTGVLAPNIGNWAPPSRPTVTTDLDAARSALAGSPSAKGASAELIYDAGNGTDTLLAQVIKDNLAKIDIEVKITGLETLAFLDRAFTLDADMTLWSYGAISPDMSDPLGWFAGTGYLFTGLDQTTFDASRLSYLTTVSADDKRKAVVAIQDEGIAQAAIIVLAETPTLHAVQSELSGFAPAPWGLYYFDTITKN